MLRSTPDALSTAATAVVVRVVSDAPPPAMRYGIPVLLASGTVGMTVALPTLAGRGAFDLMLLPVFVAAVGLGLWPALATVVVAGGAVAVLLPPLGVPWLSDHVHAGALALHVAEGSTLALLGSVLRASLRDALEVDRSIQPRGQPVPSPPVGYHLAEHLTAREVEVLRLAASGRSVSELAADLYVSPNTVKTHLARCYEKLGAHSRAEAVTLAVHWQLLRAEDLDRAARASLGDDDDVPSRAPPDEAPRFRPSSWGGVRNHPHG